MKSKKIIAGLLALTFVFGGVVLPSGVVSNSLVASASSLNVGDAFFKDDTKYVILSDDTVEISSYSLIPSNAVINSTVEYDGKVYTITKLGMNALANRTLESVTIPDTVTVIGDYVFSGCNIKSITIPDTVVSIGKCAFASSSISSIVIPDSVKSMGISVFEGCNNLKSAVIPGSIASINERTFFKCVNLESVTLNDGLRNIGKDAFNTCNSLKHINIPSSVINIGEFAFAYSDKLESVNISDGTDSINIDKFAFSGCTSLNDISIPDRVINIGEYAFNSCKSLKSVKLPDNSAYIDICVFSNCTSLENVNIPTGISSLPSSTFYGCSSLTDITIPDNIKEIKEYAFYECKNLTNVTIPDGVKSIGDRTFWNCTALKTIQIPASVTYIGKEVFSYYDSNDNKVKPLDNVTIYCYADTFAEKYAKENGLKYQLIKPKLTYPTNIKVEYNQIYHQVRLTWDKVENAKEYGIAIYQAGKWRIQKQGITTTSYTTPKDLTPGKSYKVMIAAKVDGEWDTANAIKHAVTIYIPNDTDSDGDGIEDFYEKEENISSYTIAPIIDSWIDDSESISGKNPKIPDLENLGMNMRGSSTLVSPEDKNGPRKNEIIAIRKRNIGIDATFALSTSKNSYFAFTITGTKETKFGEGYTTDDYESTVKIFNATENELTEPVEIRLSDDFTEITYVFKLEQDSAYMILVNNPTNNNEGEYEIHISEDNWLYAPNGGRQTYNTSELDYDNVYVKLAIITDEENFESIKVNAVNYTQVDIPYFEKPIDIISLAGIFLIKADPRVSAAVTIAGFLTTPIHEIVTDKKQKELDEAIDATGGYICFSSSTVCTDNELRRDYYPTEWTSPGYINRFLGDPKYGHIAIVETEVDFELLKQLIYQEISNQEGENS